MNNNFIVIIDLDVYVLVSEHFPRWSENQCPRVKSLTWLVDWFVSAEEDLREAINEDVVISFGAQRTLLTFDLDFSPSRAK
jgi:hypothetical protein